MSKLRGSFVDNRHLIGSAFSMEPVVLALASNERYFPGTILRGCERISHLDPARKSI